MSSHPDNGGVKRLEEPDGRWQDHRGTKIKENQVIIMTLFPSLTPRASFPLRVRWKSLLFEVERNGGG